MHRSRLILRVVLHIAPWEVGGRKGAPREVPRRGTRREVSRIAARGEATRIAGHRDLTRSREAAGRSQPLEPDNRAQDERRAATIPTNTQVLANLFMELRP